MESKGSLALTTPTFSTRSAISFGEKASNPKISCLNWLYILFKYNTTQ